MTKNFMAMPSLLKLLTIVVIVVPVIAVASLFPHQSISVFGHPMSASKWWSSGAGPTSMVVGCIVLTGAILMLARSRFARPVYLLGLVAVSLSSLLIAYFTGSTSPAELPSLFVNLAFVVLIGFYLYTSRAVRSYFNSAESDT